MNIDIDVLIEAYTILKEYIPVKERQPAADTLMGVLVDMLSDPDIKQLAGADSYLKRSSADYIDDEEPDED
jgi:hypothetical protein